jgi:ABC-type oligopeptide transport system substrate-binding subunit
MYCKRIIMSFAFVVVFAAVCANADVQTGKAQTLYVPAYSHVFSGDRALPFNLAVMLVIRNTDM